MYIIMVIGEEMLTIPGICTKACVHGCASLVSTIINNTIGSYCWNQKPGPGTVIFMLVR